MHSENKSDFYEQQICHKNGSVDIGVISELSYVEGSEI